MLPPENFAQLIESLNAIKAAVRQLGYKDIKDLSGRRFKILVPAAERMDAAQQIASKLGGSMLSTGREAGKPIVEFGGGYRVYVKPKLRTGVGGTAKEDAQLISLQKQIQDELETSGMIELPIKIGHKIYNVAGAATTPGTPKSDFHLLDKNGKEVVWISHKDGSTAKDFQQWGGMSPRVEPKIANHPESKKFVEDVRTMFGDKMPRATTVSRLIKDVKLANLSVFGNQYGKAFGRQNTTMVLQGPVKLKKKGNEYIITSNHTIINGDEITGGYKPAFMAIYKGDRDDFGIKGARFAIQPIASRKSKEI